MRPTGTRTEIRSPLGHLINRLRKTAFAHWLRVRYRRLRPRLEDIGIGIDHPFRFLQQAQGVIHVGANTGQEAWIYSALRKPVIWFEANPDLMDRLHAAIKPYKQQIAVNAMLLESEQESVDFYITNNDSGSSSVYPLAGHREMFPGIEVESRKTLKSCTLKSQLQLLDPNRRFDALILDVQGAELAVLKGAGDTLQQFRWIYSECADFEIYAGGCTYSSLSRWLREHGFVEQIRYESNFKPGLGATFDILFTKAG